MSCGCTVWPRCSCDVIHQPPLPAPDRVAAYLRHRAAIDARWAVADELWDGMTTGERIEATRALGDDWQPRR